MFVRRWAAVVSVLGVGLLAAACGEDREQGGADAGETAGDAVAVADVDPALGLGEPSPDLCRGEQYKIGYDVFSDTQDYAKSLLGDLEAVSEELGCVELITLVDNADASTALLNINVLIEQEVDGVILFQIVASAQEGIMQRLDNAGIPAVAHAVPAPGAPFVAPSDREAGEVAGEAIAERAANDGVAAADAYLVLGTDPATGAVSENRLGGVRDAVTAAMPDLPETNIIEIDTGSVADESLARMTETLAQIPDDATIMFSAINDDAVGGMFRAVEQAGREQNAIAAGMGGLYPSGVQAVCDHDAYVGTVDFLPETGGRYLLPAILAEINGETVPESVYTPVELLDNAGAAQKYPELSCG